MTNGTYVEIDGRPAVRFERSYPHTVERVWRAVTEPSELAFWFPSPEIEYDGRVGGSITFGGDPNLEEQTGTVLAWDPPHRFAFRWGPDELHLSLSPNPDGGTTFVLVNVLAEADTAARNASGWEVCLHELDRLLAGDPGDGPHSASTLPFEPLYQKYVAAGLPSGAPIPGYDDL